MVRRCGGYNHDWMTNNKNSEVDIRRNKILINAGSNPVLTTQ